LQIDTRVLPVKGHLSTKSGLRVHEWYCIHARMAMRVTSSRVTCVTHVEHLRVVFVSRDACFLKLSESIIFFIMIINWKMHANKICVQESRNAKTYSNCKLMQSRLSVQTTWCRNGNVFSRNHTIRNHLLL